MSAFDTFESKETPVVPMSPPTLVLTEEQNEAIERIIEWYTNGNNQEFHLGGYAGTGKTTIIRVLRERLKARTCLCAFTGKAVNVLQRKGLTDAATIHSTIYNVIPLRNGGFQFELRGSIEGRPDLIIVDEASMISRELYKDLCSFNLPMLFVGDPGQLEPVGDNPNLMAHTDFVLSKIHRQAELSPIIGFASAIRLGTRTVNDYPFDGEQLLIRPKVGMDMEILVGADQVICARNRTRVDGNMKFRDHMKRPRTIIGIGDKIIVLRNNPTFNVFNGMILFVDEVLEQTSLYFKLNAHDEIDRKFNDLYIWREPFEKDLPKEFKIPTYKDRQLVYCDWGYVITCHKSQGSEWNNVIVWDEWMPAKVWDMKRWRYTAITRAAKKLTYCL